MEIRKYTVLVSKGKLEMTPESLVKHHIHQNQTSLVNFLFEHFPDFMDEISNQFVSIKEQLLEMSEEEVWEVINYFYNEVKAIYEDDYADLKLEARSIEELVEFVFDYDLQEEFGLEEESKEFYEWILVDDWLANKLEEKGESVLSLHDSKWWGRDGCGQMYELDDVIQKIAMEY